MRRLRFTWTSFALPMAMALGLAAVAWSQAAGGADPQGHASHSGSTGPKVLMEKESLYHYVRVIEEGGVRRLQFRRAGTDFEESAIDLKDPLRLRMHYYGLMLAALAHQPNPKHVLYVGLGGGTLPMALRHYYPEAVIDAVELDPEVVEAARRYFGLKEDHRMRVYVRDGRVQVRLLARQGQKYDLVFLDAFRGGYIPYHLTTKEFMESVKAVLAPDGVVASNLQPGFESYHYHRRTLAAVFRNQWSYGSWGNVIVVTDMRPSPPSKETLLANARRLQEEKKFSVDLVAIIQEGGMRDDYQRQGPILTDDYAPTDILRSIPRE